MLTRLKKIFGYCAALDCEGGEGGAARPFFKYLFLSAFLLLPVNFLIIPHISLNAGPPEATERFSAGPFTMEKAVKKNDTFYTVMNTLKVAPGEIGHIIKKAASFHDLRRMKEGDVFRITRLDGGIQRIEYYFDNSKGLFVERDPNEEDGFKSGRLEIPSTVGETLTTGTIEDSLYGAGIKAGADPKIIMELFDIFAWDVDFATEIRKGDSFRVLYETVYVEGRPVSTGKIVGAEIINNGERYTAVYYKDTNGKSEYYDEKGLSLRRAILKSPLRYRRISSYFTGRRFHPILKVYRPHHGIDYAAPAGTPVESAGGGRVVFAGWKRGYGNFVEVKHNDVYTTGYGHLSGIKRGVRQGKKVEQGELIGFVGSTGISTGPHLHYEMRKRGALINPLSVKTEPRRRLDKKEMTAFMTQREGIIGRLAGNGNGKNMVVAMEKDNPGVVRR